MFRVTRNCTHYRRLLSDHIDKPLSERKERRLARHLATCPKCREELAFYADLKEQASQLDRGTPPSYLWERIASRLDEHPWGEEQPTPAALGNGRPWALTRVINVAGAVATLALVTALIISPIRQAQGDGAVPPASNTAMSSDVKNASLYMLANRDKFPDEVREYYVNWLSGIDRQIKTIKSALDRYPENRQIQAQLAYAYTNKLRLYRRIQSPVSYDEMARFTGYRKWFVDKGELYD